MSYPVFATGPWLECSSFGCLNVGSAICLCCGRKVRAYINADRRNLLGPLVTQKRHNGFGLAQHCGMAVFFVEPRDSNNDGFQF